MTHFEAATPTVRLERPRDGIALVTLNRPQARNSLTLELWSALESILQSLNDDVDLRAIILAGAGTYFSSGGDLKSAPAAGFRANAAVGRLQYAHRTIQTITTFPVPIIAAVEGGAAGLGWSLALACDMVFTSADATFVAPFVARGIIPDGGAGWHLVRRIGRHRASEILLGGRPVSGTEALSLGLANGLAEGGGVLAAALAFACSLPANSPRSAELTKQLLASADGIDLGHYLQLELSIATQCQQASDSVEGRLAFQNSAMRRPDGK